MTATAPASLPGSLPGGPSRAYTRIDWKTAAGLLADGQTALQAARAIGIGEDRLWRHWQRSQRFRNHVQALIERRHGLLGLQLGPAAAAAALARCQKQDGLAMDAATLALLAGGDLRPDAPAMSAQERVAAIGRAGRRKPAASGHASSPRPAASKPAPDRPSGGGGTVVVKQLFAARMKPPMTDAEPPIPSAAARVEGAPDGPERDETVPSGPKRDETVPNGTEWAETAQNGSEQAASASPPDSRGNDNPSPDRLLRGRFDFITDLPSPDFPDGIPYARVPPG